MNTEDSLILNRIKKIQNQLDAEIKNILNTIGGTADTGGSATAGTLMAKENAIIELLKSQGDIKVNAVKKVQRGITAGAYQGGRNITVTIEPVNTEKTFVNFVAVSLDATGSYVLGTGGDNSSETSVILRSSTTLEVSTNYGNTGAAVAWEVIEFY